MPLLLLETALISACRSSNNGISAIDPVLAASTRSWLSCSCVCESILCQELLGECGCEREQATKQLTRGSRPPSRHSLHSIRSSLPNAPPNPNTPNTRTHHILASPWISCSPWMSSPRCLSCSKWQTPSTTDRSCSSPTTSSRPSVDTTSISISSSST